MDNEVWKPIPGFEGYYEASDQGRVRSLSRYGILGKGMGMKKGKVLKRGKCGLYFHHGLCKGGVQGNYSVHRLVMLTFVGPRPEGLEICHGDGDPENNTLGNLRYGTKIENAADKSVHRTNNEGDTNPRAKLTADEVMGIYIRCEKGEPQNEIAKELNISQITVNHIATGRTWSSVTGKTWGRSHASITPKIVREIERLQAEGRTLDQISDELGISKPSAFRHSKGKSKVLRDEALFLIEGELVC